MASLTSRLADVIAKEGPFYNMGSLIQAVGQDEPISRGQVAGSLYSLTRQGVVSLREHDGRLVYVEATKKGYREAGVPEQPVAAQAGSAGSRKLPSLHPGDLTDFRNHGRTAIGGPVTRVTAGVREVVPDDKRGNRNGSRTYRPGRVAGTTVAKVREATLGSARFTNLEVRRKTGLSETAVGDTLALLREEGTIEATNPGGRPVYWRYVGTPPAPAPEDTTQVEDVADEFPALTALRAKAAKAAKVAEAVDHLLAVAALTGDESYLERATVLEADEALTPLEAEYLRYAEARR